MLLLPSDLQLEIIKLLDPHDIVHLQLTCRYFNVIIDEAGTLPWRECLLRHCQRNQLFSPSYDNLSTVSEYKHAVTAPVRFIKSYDEAALRPGDCMASLVTDLELERDSPDLERDGWVQWVDKQIRDIYLIRGGRFLIVWTNTSYEIWDLHAAPHPKLAFSQTLGRVDYLMYTNAPTNDKVHLLWSQSVPDHSIATQSVYDVGHCEKWILVELTYHEKEGFFAERYENTFIYNSRMDMAVDLNIVSGEDKILFLSSNMTLLWDYTHNSFAGWTLEVQGGLPYAELFLIQNYLIYISSDGLSGLHLPRMARPEPVYGDYIDFRDLCSLPTNPSFFLPYGRGFVFEGYDVGSPDICQPLDGALSMLYDIRCRQGTGPFGPRDAPPDLYRYAFTLDPDNPTQSTLELLQVLKCAYPESDLYISSSSLINYHQRCNGRFGVTWQNHVALSKPAPLQASANTNPDLREVSLQFVPLHERVYRTSFCPASSKAVVQFKKVNESGSIVTHLTMYDF